MMIIAIVITIGFIALAFYASCTAASDADDKMDYDDIYSHSGDQNEADK